MKPRMIHPRVFLFSHRIALGKAFEKWARENRVALCWENFVAFLDINGMLNKEAAMEFLKKEEEHSIDADRYEIDPISIRMDGGEMRGMMRTIIAAEPTIDAVPVTRCRDCVSSEYVIEPNTLPYYRCPHVNFDIYPDFYCAYGRERIADGRDHSPTDQD